MRSYERELAEERRMKDRFMAEHPESPFADSSAVAFRPLQYFVPDPKYRVRARLERLDPPREAYLRTNRDGEAAMSYLGDLAFSLGGRDLRLRVFHAGVQGGASVFVPFRDGTSGLESYGPGRYLTLELNEQDLYQLDFNRAFNPYCAYTDAYECGFPPAENDLPVRIPAGEKAWSPSRNPGSPSSAIRALYRRPVRRPARRAPAPSSRPRSPVAKAKPR